MIRLVMIVLIAVVASIAMSEPADIVSCASRVNPAFSGLAANSDLSQQPIADPAWFIDAARARPLTVPITGMDDAELDQFILGKSFFSIPWVVAPSATTARDGLGPLFNANTCTSCHVDNSSAIALDAAGLPTRGLTIKLVNPSGEPLVGTLSIPDAVRGDPVYGGQIATNGSGLIKSEGRLIITPVSVGIPAALPGKFTATLTRFEPRLVELNYGALSPGTQIGLRQAPALVGLGLVERTDDAELFATADPEDADGDGISGVINQVYDIASGKTVAGRYGYKASQPTIKQQSADAAIHDMGLTNPYFPVESCTPTQLDCQQAPRGRATPLGELDLPEPRLAAIDFYLTHLRAPMSGERSAAEQQGAAWFQALGCASCHRLSMRTRDGVEYHPYSDFLLHDMGAGLADQRAEFLASGREWRTAPLWSLGSRIRAGKRFLHDARAASVHEAILWHGGEAAAAQQRYQQLAEADRQQLLQFLETL